jgi:hypothetical protein
MLSDTSMYPSSTKKESSMKFARTCIALAAMAPMLASAAIGPGQWNLAGFQQICLTSGGTWYATTFSGWGGAWGTYGGKVHIYGNYASGAGNDSMVFNKKGTKGSWTEWRDDLSFHTVFSPTTLTFVKADCDPPAVAVPGKSDPAR